MIKTLKYKIIIGILLLIIFIQAGFILRSFLRKRPTPIRAEIARIALVLDDWGYNLNNLGILKEIDYPLTLAILPHLEYSQEVAHFAKIMGKELILHIPLEPKKNKDYLGWEKFTITTSMSEDRIKDVLLKAIESLGEIKGVSNHMGSGATEDESTMTIIFKELKKRGLYFLDSYVTANSICRKVAGKLSLKFISRDIFLDNQKDPTYIRNQFKKLKLKALKKGWALGVGHAHRVTLEALKKEMFLAKKEGFRFVFLSELLK